MPRSAHAHTAVEEVPGMAKLMSEQLKDRFAFDLGVQETVRREGWGAVPARECGSLVRLAIQAAEQQMSAGPRTAGHFPPSR